jgi:Na+/H+ antiporter NhaD/arsenite permease-like protein
VPFLWAALHCWPQWLTATGALLLIFFVADTIACSGRCVAETPSTHFHCYGKWNFGALLALLDYAEFHATDFHLASDARFYWGTGLLSGVLDNAPTYLTFLTAALSIDRLDINHLPDVAEFAFGHGSRLAAISLAATLFGGFTYIGNSPNLLIRAIAESRHVPAPGFLAYIIKYALPVLIPVLALVGLIFFRG